MKYVLILCTALSVMACQSNGQQSVKGKIVNGEGKKVSLIGYSVKGEPDTLGTALLNAEGDFEIPVKGGRLNFYSLALQDNGSLILAFDSIHSPEVTGDMDYINRDYQVSGSPESERIRDLFVTSRGFELRMDSTMKLMQSPESIQNESERTTRAAYFNELRSKYREFLLEFIDGDTASIANMSALQRLDPNADLSYFIKVRNGLKPKLQGNVFYDGLANNIGQLEAKAKASETTQAGREALDIVMPDPNGNQQSLSSLRGKYVLIDFWASWCKPCRMENPNVVRLYNTYKNDNFEIFGVSLDQNKEKWVEAIQADNLPWMHVSDLQFWNSAAARLYNVQSIPFTVLVDPDGKIMETNLRGPALAAKLEQIFGH